MTSQPASLGHSPRRNVRLVIIIVWALLAVLPQRVSAAEADWRYFPETQHSMGEEILAFWQKQGDLPVFGYPISQLFPEGRVELQYLERNRIEYHSLNKPPHEILLGRLGVDVLVKQGREWQSFPKAAPSAAHYFKETGHAIAHAPFWAYWSTHGLELDGRKGVIAAEALALWGYPLSEPQVETNAAGDTVLTQWFERARFEDHGAKGVLLGLLGREVAQGRQEWRFLPVKNVGTITDPQAIVQHLFELTNQGRRQAGLEPLVYYSELQGLANEFAKAATESFSRPDAAAVLDAYQARLGEATPPAQWTYFRKNQPLTAKVCRGVDPSDPLQNAWEEKYAARELGAEYIRSTVIGIYGPYEAPSSCGTSISLVFILSEGIPGQP